MRYIKILAGGLCLLSLSGCWFVFIPVGLIVRAFEGPRLCVVRGLNVGAKVKDPNGKMATITKIQGPDSACQTESLPILVNISYDEEKQPASQPEKQSENKDTHFIAYDNGTVLDTRTNLMWAAKDNGSDIGWADAKSYCENYRGGGYTDWRMPKQYELAGLYDTAKTYISDCEYDVHLTELIHLTCTWAWSAETRGSEAAIFYFNNGIRFWNPQSNIFTLRALPVRYGK